MKKLTGKLLIDLLFHITGNCILVALSQSVTVISHKSAFLIELCIVLLLQIPAYSIYKTHPFSEKHTMYKVWYWLVSLIFTATTAWFWMYEAVGPL